MDHLISSQTVVAAINDTVGGQAAIAVMTGVAFILPLFFVLKTVSWADKSLHWTANKVKGAAQSATNSAKNMGKKAAMNSKYGQAAQQFMNQRKQISSLKGQEALRGALNKNPNLAKLMGGAGGSQYASRFLDTANRKHEAEQIQELSKGITLPMANAIARHESLSDALNKDEWADGKKLKDEDRAGIRRMQSQGYLSADGRVSAGHPHSAIAASAALQEIYNSDDVTAEKVRGLGGLLQGAGTEANSNFTKLNRDLAVRGKNKNVAYTSFNDGSMDQWAGKKPDGVLASGLQGMNKDALKYSNVDLPDSTYNPRGENALLYNLQKDVGTGANRDLAKVVERTRQTMDQSHQEVIEGLSHALGFGNINPADIKNLERTVSQKRANGQNVSAELSQIANMKNGLDQQVNSFRQLRLALQNGSTSAPPAEFAVVLGQTPAPAPPPVPTPTPAPAPQVQPLIVPHPPSGNGPSTRPRSSNFS